MGNKKCSREPRQLQSLSLQSHNDACPERGAVMKTTMAEDGGAKEDERLRG
jgi:hypothetical protein